jgi:hypothetical protein
MAHLVLDTSDRPTNLSQFRSLTSSDLRGIFDTLCESNSRVVPSHVSSRSPCPLARLRLPVGDATQGLDSWEGKSLSMKQFISSRLLQG